MTHTHDRTAYVSRNTLIYFPSSHTFAFSGEFSPVCCHSHKVSPFCFRRVSHIAECLEPGQRGASAGASGLWLPWYISATRSRSPAPLSTIHSCRDRRALRPSHPLSLGLAGAGTASRRRASLRNRGWRQPPDSDSVVVGSRGKQVRRGRAPTRASATQQRGGVGGRQGSGGSGRQETLLTAHEWPGSFRSSAPRGRGGGRPVKRGGTGTSPWRAVAEPPRAEGGGGRYGEMASRLNEQTRRSEAGPVKTAR